MTVSEEKLQELLEEYKRGVQTGIKLMQEKMMLACETGKPVEINGRAYFIKSDIQNLRDIMDNLEV